MSTDLVGLVRDLLVLAYMFVLRIGVPLLVTLMIGAWLKRLLEEREAKPEAESLHLGLGQHCWDVIQTDDTWQAHELAGQRPDLPCWLALQVGGRGIKGMCYGCPIYNAQPAHAAVKA